MMESFKQEKLAQSDMSCLSSGKRLSTKNNVSLPLRSGSPTSLNSQKVKRCQKPIRLDKQFLGFYYNLSKPTANPTQIELDAARQAVMPVIVNDNKSISLTNSKLTNIAITTGRKHEVLFGNYRINSIIPTEISKKRDAWRETKLKLNWRCFPEPTGKQTRFEHELRRKEGVLDDVHGNLIHAHYLNQNNRSVIKSDKKKFLSEVSERLLTSKVDYVNLNSLLKMNSKPNNEKVEINTEASQENISDVGEFKIVKSKRSSGSAKTNKSKMIAQTNKLNVKTNTEASQENVSQIKKNEEVVLGGFEYFRNKGSKFDDLRRRWLPKLKTLEEFDTLDEKTRQGLFKHASYMPWLTIPYKCHKPNMNVEVVESTTPYPYWASKKVHKNIEFYPLYHEKSDVIIVNDTIVDILPNKISFSTVNDTDTVMIKTPIEIISAEVEVDNESDINVSRDKLAESLKLQFKSLSNLSYKTKREREIAFKIIRQIYIYDRLFSDCRPVSPQVINVKPLIPVRSIGTQYNPINIDNELCHAQQATWFMDEKTSPIKHEQMESFRANVIEPATYEINMVDVRENIDTHNELTDKAEYLCNFIDYYKQEQMEDEKEEFYKQQYIKRCEDIANNITDNSILYPMIVDILRTDFADECSKIINYRQDYDHDDLQRIVEVKRYIVDLYENDIEDVTNYVKSKRSSFTDWESKILVEDYYKYKHEKLNILKNEVYRYNRFRDYSNVLGMEYNNGVEKQFVDTFYDPISINVVDDKITIHQKDLKLMLKQLEEGSNARVEVNDFGLFGVLRKILEVKMEQANLSDIITRGDIWNKIICANKSSMILWWVSIALLSCFLPYVGLPLFWWSIYEAMSMNFSDRISVIKTDLLDPLVRTSGELTTQVNSVITNADNLVKDIRGVEEDTRLNLFTMTHNAKRHAVALAACVQSAINAETTYQLASEGVKAASMLGLEKCIMANIFTSVSENIIHTEQADFDRADDLLSGVRDSLNSGIANTLSTINNTKWDPQKLAGILGLATSIAGFSFNGKSPLKFLTSASAESKAIEDLWGKIESYLNTIGVLNTGKWAYLKELAEDINKLESEITYFNQLYAATPSFICKSDVYRRWIKLKSEISRIEKIMIKNNCPDVKNSSIAITINRLVNQVQKWEQIATRIRETNGTRPEPVGLCFFGDSGVGKSRLWHEVMKRLKDELYRRYVEDPSNLASFADVKQWTCWNMQNRDDFDQGSDGQDFVYCDDAFCSTDNNDHLIWLTFISNQMIGTVQASIEDKGRPFRARLCTVTCNNLPASSITINNIYALHNRFPFCIKATVKEDANVPSNSTYDPDFNHLRLQLGSMAEWVDSLGLSDQVVNKRNGPKIAKPIASVIDTSRHPDISLSELVQKLADKMIMKEESYISQLTMASTNTTSRVNIEQYETENTHPIQGWNSKSATYQDKVAALSMYEHPAIETSQHPTILELASLFSNDRGPLLPQLEERGHSNETLIWFFFGSNQFQQLPDVDDRARNLFTRLSLVPLRIRYLQNREDYLWSPGFLEGKVFVKIPYLEGTATVQEILNGGYTDYAYITQRITSHVIELRKIAKQYDINLTRSWNSVWNLPIPAACLSPMHIVISTMAMRFLSGFPFPYAVLRDPTDTSQYFQFTRQCGHDIRSPHTSWFQKAASAIYMPFAPISDLLVIIRSWCVWAANKVVDVFIWILELCGLDLSFALESVARYVTEIGLTVAAASLLPIVAVLMYVAVKWVLKYFKGESNEHTKNLEYSEKSKAKRRDVKVVKDKSIRRLQSDWKHKTQPIAKHDCKMEQSSEECHLCWLSEHITISDKNIIATNQHVYFGRYNDSDVDMYARDTFVYFNGEHVDCNMLSSKLDFDNVLDAIYLAVKDAKGDKTNLSAFFEKHHGKYTDDNTEHDNFAFCLSDDIELSDTDDLRVTKVTRQPYLGEDNKVYRALIVEMKGISEFEQHHLYPKIKYFFKKYNIGSWFVQGQLLNNIWWMRFVLLSTLDINNTETLFTKNTIALMNDDIRYLEGKIDVPITANIASIIDNIKSIKTEESADDASIDTLKRIMRHNMICVMSTKKNKADTQWSKNIETRNGGYCGAIVSGKEVFLPGHIAEPGDILKGYIWNVCTFDELEIKPMTKYFAILVTYKLPIRDLAYGRIISRDELVEYAKKTDQSITNFESCNRRVIEFKNWIDSAVMSEEELIRVMGGVQVIFYLPQTGICGCAIANYVGRETCTIHNHEEGIVDKVRTWIELSQIECKLGISSNGDCGGPLVVFNSKHVHKFVGIHVASSEYVMNSAFITSDDLKCFREVREEQSAHPISVITTNIAFEPEHQAGYGYQQFEGWPKIEWVPKELDYFSQCVVKGKGIDTPKGPCIQPLGVYTGTNSSSRVNDKSHWVKGPFFGAFDIEKEPAPMSAYDPRITAELPKNDAGKPSLLLGPNSVMGEKLPVPELDAFQKAIDSLHKRRFNQYYGKDISCKGMSIDDMVDFALNGKPTNKHMTGMKTAASSGLPWTSSVGYEKKSDLISTDEHTGIRSFTHKGEKLRTHLYNKLLAARHRRRMFSFCSSKKKDIDITKENVAKGKTRIFNGSAVEDVMFGNALWGKFKEEYIKGGLDFNHAIGINVHSLEWTDLYNYLNKFKCCTDFDYKNYDKHLLSVFMRAVFMSRIKIIKEQCDDGWEDARYVGAENDINSIMVDEQSVYMTEHSNKSGTFSTTDLNNEVNVLMLLYCFIKLVVEANIGYTADDFWLLVRLVCFGDDAVMSISELIVHLYNFNTIRACLASMGQEATPGLKYEGDIPDFVDITKLTFLKRQFVVHDSIVVAPLEPKSIRGVYGWTDTDWDNVEVIAPMVKQNIYEALLHGREFYDDFCQRLLNKSRERHIKPHLKDALQPLFIYSYDDMWIKYLKVLEVHIEEVNDEPTKFSQYITKRGLTVFEGLDSLGLVTIAEDVEGALKTITELDKQLKPLLEVPQKLADLQNQVNNNGTDIGNIHTQVSQLGSDVGNMSKQLVTLSENISNLSAKVATIDGYTIGNIAAIARIENDITILQASHVTYNKEIAELKNDVTTLNDETSKVATRVGNNEANIANNIYYIKLNDTAIKDLKTVVSNDETSNKRKFDEIDQSLTTKTPITDRSYYVNSYAPSQEDIGVNCWVYGWLGHFIPGKRYGWVVCAIRCSYDNGKLYQVSLDTYHDFVWHWENPTVPVTGHWYYQKTTTPDGDRQSIFFIAPAEWTEDDRYRIQESDIPYGKAKSIAEDIKMSNKINNECKPIFNKVL